MKDGNFSYYPMKGENLLIMRGLYVILLILLVGNIPYVEPESPQLDYYRFENVKASIIKNYSYDQPNGNTIFILKIEVHGNYIGYYHDPEYLSLTKNRAIKESYNLTNKQIIELSFAEKTGEPAKYIHPEKGSMIIVDFELGYDNYEENSTGSHNRNLEIRLLSENANHDNMDFESFLELRKTEPVWFWTTLIVPIVVILLVIFTIVKLRKMKKVQNKGQDADSIKTPAPKVIRHQKIK